MGKIEFDSGDWKAIQGMEAKAISGKGAIRVGLRAFLAKHSLLSPEERVAAADRVRAMTPRGVAQTDSTEMVRALRDGRHLRD